MPEPSQTELELGGATYDEQRKQIIVEGAASMREEAERLLELEGEALFRALHAYLQAAKVIKNSDANMVRLKVAPETSTILRIVAHKTGMTIEETLIYAIVCMCRQESGDAVPSLKRLMDGTEDVQRVLSNLDATLAEMADLVEVNAYMSRMGGERTKAVPEDINEQLEQIQLEFREETPKKKAK